MSYVLKLARVLLPTLLAATVPFAGAANSLPDDTFARVGSITLSAADFNAAFRAAPRDKFYHSKPPEGELALFQREVGNDLNDRVPAVEEAKRRGIKPKADDGNSRKGSQPGESPRRGHGYLLPNAKRL